MRRWPILFALLWQATAAAAGHVPQQVMPSLAPMLEQVTPAVVNVATLTTVKISNPLLDDPFFRQFFNVPESSRYRQTQAAGSGVVVDARAGYILTNNHVIDHADRISISLADGRSLPAKLIGSDPQVDLAVLQVDAKGLQQITFADSSALRVGDYVVAIGNPFGLDQTVTSGIVSALGRSGLGIEGYEDFIQTDASINPGNSGGALVNLRGELVGINTAILTHGGGNVGIGFAIPSNLVRAIMQQLIRYGEVKRGRLGVRIQALNADLAEAFAVNERKGVVVVRVDRNSAAAHAGIEPGDVVVSMNGHPIRRVADFYSQSALLMVGDKVAVDVLRDGAVKSLQVDIETDQYEQMVGDEVDSRLSGVELQNFHSQGDATTDSGVLVTGVTDNSLAWARGLRAGDIIVALNRQPCRNLKSFVATARQLGNRLLLRVYRAGEFGYIELD